MRRRLVTVLGFACGLLVATAFVRRGAGRRRRRLDLYYDDGSMVSLADGSPDAERLLPLAQEILHTARG